MGYDFDIYGHDDPLLSFDELLNILKNKSHYNSDGFEFSHVIEDKLGFN